MHMKKRAFLVSVALGGLLVASIVFLSSTHSTTAAYSAYGAVPTAIPSVPVPPSKVPKHRPITFNGGVPAVKHPGGGPVTVADVRAFIAINGFAASANGKTTNGTMHVVLQATLMTAQQASD